MLNIIIGGISWVSRAMRALVPTSPAAYSTRNVIRTRKSYSVRTVKCL